VPEQITLEAPLDDDFQPVVRLIVGGIATHAAFGFDDLDDLQLAIERLLAEAGADGRVALSFEVRPGAIGVRIGPLHDVGLVEALKSDGILPGGLTLARILQTVVSSFAVEVVGDGDIVVRLEKLAEGS